MKNMLIIRLILVVICGFVILPVNVSAQCSGSSDLATHVSEQIDGRLGQSSPSTGLALFSNPLSDFGTASKMTWNADSWTRKGIPLDFTGVAVWNDQGVPYQEGATLITPRHFVAATHVKIAVGKKVTFVSADGNLVTRTVTGLVNIPDTDITVEALDSDVDSSIINYKLINSATLISLLYKNNISSEVPVAVFNQLRKILIRSLKVTVSHSMIHDKYTSGTRSGFSSNLISGDSGEPGFLIINNKPILVFVNSSITYGSNLGDYIAQINQAINSLGSNGYSVTEYDLSCFTKYSTTPVIGSILADKVNNCIQGSSTCRPVIKGIGFTSQNNILTTGALNINQNNLPSRNNGSEITFDVPANANPGTYNISVSNGNGTSNIKTFTIRGTPHISSVHPSSGPMGSVITLTGANFSKIGENNVQLNSRSLNLSSSAVSTDGTHLTVTLPNRNVSVGTAFKILVDNDEFGFSDEDPYYESNPAVFTVAVGEPVTLSPCQTDQTTLVYQGINYGCFPTSIVLLVNALAPGSVTTAASPVPTPTPTPTLTPTPTPTTSPAPISTCYQFRTNLTVDSTGTDVVALQTWLIAKGFDIPLISTGRVAKGYFGPSTSAAIGRYQASVGLSVTGELDARTKEKINASCGVTALGNVPSSPITLKRPNGGETFVAGQTIPTVSWTSANLPASTNIDGLRFTLVSSNGASYQLTVTKNSWFTAGFSGSYTNNGSSFISDLSIPATVPAGQYKLKINCPSCGGANEDISDAYFTVQNSDTKPSLSLISPSANQNIVAGQPITIRWSSSNILQSEKITILFSNSNNTTIGYPAPDHNGVPNTGSYTWTVPADIKLGKYKVQISCAECYKRAGVMTYVWGGEFNVIAPTTPTQPSSSNDDSQSYSSDQTSSPSSNPTPSPTYTASPTSVPTPSPSTPEPTPSPSPSVTPSASPSPSSSPTQSPEAMWRASYQTGSVWEAVIRGFRGLFGK